MTRLTRFMATTAMASAVVQAPALAESAPAKPAEKPLFASGQSLAPGGLEVAGAETDLRAGQVQVAQAEESGSTTELGEITVREDRPYKPDNVQSPKYTRELLDTPKSITVIDEEVLDDQQTTTLEEVFRNVPGISIQAGEGNPGAGDQLSIRGFTARDDLFIDGIRDVGNVRRDSFNLESVEIGKGPSSTFQGRGTAGGFVNQVTKTPKREFFVETEGKAGTNELFRGTADVNVPLDDFGLDNAAVRLNVMAHDQEFADRDVVEDTRWGIAPSLAFGLGTDTELTFAYQHMSQDNTPGSGIPNVRDAFLQDSGFLGEVAPVDDDSFFGQEVRDEENIDQDIVTARLKHEFTSDFRVQTKFRFQSTRNDSIISSPRIQDDGTGQLNPNTMVTGDSKPRDQTDRLFVNQTDATSEFNTGGIGHTFVSGFEIGHQDLENDRRLDASAPETFLFNPNSDIPASEFAEGALNRTFTGQTTKVDSDFAGLYMINDMQLTDRLALMGSVRYDVVTTRVQGKGSPGEDTPFSNTDETRTDQEFSGSASISYKPAENGNVYFAFGSSFAPTLSAGTETSGVFQPAGGNPTGSPAEGGFDADPERTNTFEIGTKWEVLKNRLRVEGSVFRTIKTNARDVNSLEGTVDVSGEERIRGFEISAQGAILPNWHILAGYTFLDGEVLESDIEERLPSGEITSREGLDTENTPESSFTAWTTYTLPWQPVDFGFGAEFVGERQTFQGRTDRAIIRADSFWKFDLMARYRLNENFQFQANVLNITDKDFIQGLGTGQSVPGEGRTALFSGRINF